MKLYPDLKCTTISDINTFFLILRVTETIIHDYLLVIVTDYVLYNEKIHINLSMSQNFFFNKI